MTQGKMLTVAKTNVVRSAHDQVDMEVNLAGNNASASSEQNKPHKREQVTLEDVNKGRQYTMAENKRKQSLQYQRQLKQYKKKLGQSKEQLGYVNEKLEHGNEQLEHVNEKLEYGNEQLEHVNEKLEHGNEQLEHVNEKLEHGNEQLEHVNEKLEHDNEQLEHVNEKLEHGNEQLEHVNEKLKHGNEQLEHASEQIEQAHEQLELGYEQLDHATEQMEYVNEQTEHSNEKKKSGNEQLEHGDDQLKHGSEQLDYRDEQLEHGNEQLGNNYKQQEQDVERSALGNEQTEHGGVQLEHGNVQLEHGNEQLEHGNEQSEHGNRHLEHGNKQLELCNAHIEHSKVQLELGNEQLKHGNEQLEHGNEQLEHSNHQIEHGTEPLKLDNEQLKHGNEQLEHGNEQLEHGNVQREHSNEKPEHDNEMLHQQHQQKPPEKQNKQDTEQTNLIENDTEHEQGNIVIQTQDQLNTYSEETHYLQEQLNKHNFETTEQQAVQPENRQENTDLQKPHQQQEITEMKKPEQTIVIHCEEITDQQPHTLNNENFVHEVHTEAHNSTSDTVDSNSEAMERKDKKHDNHTMEESKTVKDTDTANEDGDGHVQLKTLADLICLCRSRGLQIYNDKSNRPETDKLLYSEAELKKTDDRGSRMSKRHCSDDRAASERTKSSVKSHPRNGITSASTSSYYHFRRDRLNTGTSFMTSTSYHSSRLESRSSMRSGMDRRLVTEDVDVDELLQQRMWKKSKRRREQKLSLLEVAKQKQQEIEASTIINHLKKTISNANMVDTTAKCSVNAEEPIIGDTVFDDNVQEGSQASTGDSDILSGVEPEKTQQGNTGNLVEQLCKQAENDDSSNLTSEENPEIQEFRIQDGDTTLILYKLKTNEIKNLHIRNEIIAKSRLSDNQDEVEMGEASLKNNECHNSSSNNQVETIGRSECDTHVNNDTAPPVESQAKCGSGEDNSQIGTSDTAINSPGDDTTQGMNETSMDTQRRRKFSEEDTHASENLKSTDSGISSDSEKESITQRHLNSVNGEHRRNKGQKSSAARGNQRQDGDSSVQSTVNHKDVLKPKSEGPTMDNYKTRRADGKSSETESKSSDTKIGHKKTKKSKRSLGNGFLVSSDNEDELDTNRTTAGSGSQSLETKSNRTKSEAVAFNDMTREARMVLLMAKIRQRYDEEKQTQSTYLQELSDTRQHLRHEYKHLKTKIDTEPLPEAKNEEPPKQEVIKPKQKQKPEPELPRPKPVRKPAPRPKPAPKPAPKPEPPKEEDEENKPKKVVGSRIDCKWSPRHPLYDQIKSGFKSSIVIPNNVYVPKPLRYVKHEQHKQWRASSVDDVYPNRDKGLSKGPNGVITTRSVDDRNLHFADDEQGSGVHSKLRRKRREFQEGYRPRSKSLQERISQSRYEESERLQESDLNEITTKAKVYNRNSSKQSKNSDLKPAKQQSDKNSTRPQDPLLNRTAGNHVTNHVTTNGVGSKGGSYNTSRTVSRQTLRSVSTQTPSGEIPISLAVNIVQSRNRFYAENVGEEVTPREHRVARLFSELKKVRQRRDKSEEPMSDKYSASSMDLEKDASFLFMDYNKPSTPLGERQSDRDLNNFLYKSLNYELCNKGRPLYVGPDRKERALNVLKNKVNNKMQFGTRVG